MTAEAPKPSQTLTQFLTRTRAGQAILTQERDHLHDERAALVEQLQEIDSEAEAAAVVHNAEMRSHDVAVKQAHDHMQAVMGARHKVRTAWSGACQQRDRKKNAILRKLEKTADEAIRGLRDVLSTNASPQRLTNEEWDAWQVRGEAIRAAIQRLDEMTREAIPPAELDKQLAALVASIPNYEATFNQNS